MILNFKKIFYFPLAYYFRFFAKIQLLKWKPKIVVITGSSGKTTLLHLIESQLGNLAKYSHHANSSYGVPFDILGLERKTLTIDEWFYLFILAPFKAFKKPFAEKFYVVEADCDRPFEGKFLSSLLKPDITIWLSSSRTHGMNFDHLVLNKFKEVEEAIAYEYGFFIENTTDFVIADKDNELIKKQIKRTQANIEYVSLQKLIDYSVSGAGTVFKTKDITFSLKILLPQEAFVSLSATKKLINYLNLKFNSSFDNFKLPPGRSSLFKGFKNTKLIDSTYNSNFESLKAIINLLDKFPAKTKWAVIGDMFEQGNVEKEEHEKIAGLLKEKNFDKVILMGSKVSKYTFPKLKELISKEKIEKFLDPKEALDYLKKNIKGTELIMFKGAQGVLLDGVVENLLLNKNDAKYLCRRGKFWDRKRKNLGL